MIQVCVVSVSQVRVSVSIYGARFLGRMEKLLHDFKEYSYSLFSFRATYKEEVTFLDR